MRFILLQKTSEMVGTSGIEPPTTTMSRWCSTTELRAYVVTCKNIITDGVAQAQCQYESFYNNFSDNHSVAYINGENLEYGLYQ